MRSRTWYAWSAAGGNAAAETANYLNQVRGDLRLQQLAAALALDVKGKGGGTANYPQKKGGTIIPGPPRNALLGPFPAAFFGFSDGKPGFTGFRRLAAAQPAAADFKLSDLDFFKKRRYVLTQNRVNPIPASHR